MLRHYPLKTLPDYRREGYWSLVNKAVYASLFRGENDVKAFTQVGTVA